MGSAAVRDPALVADVRRASSPVAVGLDHRDGEVAVHGWTEGSGRAARSTLLEWLSRRGGVRDHRHRPRRDAHRARHRRTRRCSGARPPSGHRQRRRRDARRRRARSRGVPGIAGVITGKALYEGRFTVAEALAVLAVGAAMRVARVIPCLDVTNGRVVKGVNFVGLRDAGDPVELAAALRRRGRRRVGVPRHHGVARRPRHDGRRRAPHRRAGVHPVHRRRWHPQRRGRPRGCCAPAPTRCQRQHGRRAAARADRRDRRRVRRAVRACARSTPSARRPTACGFEVFLHGGRTPTGIDAVEWAARGGASSVPARSCSRRWTATARRTASTSS